MLAEYTNTFSTVEVNGTFYSLPDPETVHDWCSSVPGDFLFSVKASRYITHMKKLKDPEDPLENLYGILDPFGDRLGPVLFQLPPNWNVNVDRLKGFTGALSNDYRYAFEFRNSTWLCDEVYEVLESEDIALCFFDYEQEQSPEKVTTDFIYVRLHGPENEAYKGSYKDGALDDYASKFRDWKDSGKAVFCYFDNDEKGYAPSDAGRLADRL
jgi:uncharacterized protein YecE (DUF72 family)